MVGWSNFFVRMVGWNPGTSGHTKGERVILLFYCSTVLELVEHLPWTGKDARVA